MEVNSVNIQSQGSSDSVLSMENLGSALWYRKLFLTVVPGWELLFWWDFFCLSMELNAFTFL